jgi:hypothetical protein
VRVVVRDDLAGNCLGRVEEVRRSCSGLGLFAFLVVDVHLLRLAVAGADMQMDQMVLVRQARQDDSRHLQA